MLFYMLALSCSNAFSIALLLVWSKAQKITLSKLSSCSLKTLATVLTATVAASFTG